MDSLTLPIINREVMKSDNRYYIAKEDLMRESIKINEHLDGIMYQAMFLERDEMTFFIILN